MFADAVERIKNFTRPIHSIARFYGHAPIVPGSATLFFVNEFGDALTCRHVANNIVRAEKINANYLSYRGKEGEFRNHPDKARLQRELLPKYDVSLEALNNPLSLPKVLTSS